MIRLAFWFSYIAFIIDGIIVYTATLMRAIDFTLLRHATLLGFYFSFRHFRYAEIDFFIFIFVIYWLYEAISYLHEHIFALFTSSTFTRRHFYTSV